jgi:hypothetical protein
VVISPGKRLIVIDACKTPPRHLPIRHRRGRSGAVIRVQMVRQDTRHPDKHCRHQGWAWCEVAGRRFETEGPAPIYKLATLLWLHGRGGEDFEVWDDLSPFDNPGGLAMTGRVRNWARLVNGKPKFDRKASPDPDFTPDERSVVVEAAGKVTGQPQRVPPSGDKARTAAISPPDGPNYPQDGDGDSTAVVGPQTLEAA